MKVQILGFAIAGLVGSCSTATSLASPVVASVEPLPIAAVADDSSHILFCYGHRIMGTVTFEIIGDRLAVNGFLPELAKTDSAARESVAQEAFAAVPMVTRLRQSGMSYHQAGRAYEQHIHNTFRAAMHAYKAALLAGIANADSVAKRLLDSELVDLSRPIGITQTSVTAYLRGIGLYVENYVDTPSARSPDSATRARAARHLALRIAGAMQSAQPQLVILGRSSLAEYAGAEEVRAAMAEISTARTRIAAGLDLDTAVGGRVPKKLLREIVAAEEGAGHETR